MDGRTRAGTVGRLLDVGRRETRYIVRTAPARNAGDGFGRAPTRERERAVRERAGRRSRWFLRAPFGPATAEAVETLRSMGFDEGRRDARALAMGNNNLEIATNILLEGR